MKTDAGQRGCKEISAAQAPQHRTGNARDNAGREQRRERCELAGGTAFDYFVQMAALDAAARKPRVEIGDPEWQGVDCRRAAAFGPFEPAAQFGNRSWLAGLGHPRVSSDVLSVLHLFSALKESTATCKSQ